MLSVYNYLSSFFKGTRNFLPLKDLESLLPHKLISEFGQRFDLSPSAQRVSLSLLKEFDKQTEVFTPYLQSAGITPSEFRFFLSLYSRTNSPAARERIEKALQELEVPQENITTLTNLFWYDSLTLYLEGSLPREEACEQIDSMAKRTSLSLGQFFDLFILLFRVSLPLEKQRSLLLNDGGKRKIEDLSKALVCSSPLSLDQLLTLPSLEDYSHAFFRSAYSLTEEINRLDNELLTLLPGGDQRKLEECKSSHKKMRAVFLRFVRERDHSKFKAQYLQSEDRVHPTVFPFYSTGNSTSIQKINLEQLYHAASRFRRRYLTRCPHKLATWLPEFEPEVRSLLSLNWITGTSSGILHNLPKTQYTLLPTGELKKRNILLLSGELENGSTTNGINAIQLSGTQIAGFSEALKYARGYSVNIEYEKKRLGEILTQQYPNSAALIRAAFAIKRLRALKETIDFPQLREKIGSLRQALSKSENARGIQALLKDEYERANLEDSRDAIQLVEEALTSPVEVLKENEKREILDPFPIVAGSHTLPVIQRDNVEFMVNQEAQLGRDIQVLFVPEERMQQMTDWLTYHHIQGVTVQKISLLEKIAAASKQLIPHFGELVSLKKLQTV